MLTKHSDREFEYISRGLRGLLLRCWKKYPSADIHVQDGTIYLVKNGKATNLVEQGNVIAKYEYKTENEGR